MCTDGRKFIEKDAKKGHFNNRMEFRKKSIIRRKVHRDVEGIKTEE